MKVGWCFRNFAFVSDGLFFEVELGEHFLVKHRGFALLLDPSHGFQPADLGRTPHLVGVQLVGASEFVSIFLSVHAGKKSVFGLPAEFFVPELLGAGAGKSQSIR